MESPCQVILDNTNYFQWWSYIVDLLRSKGLYGIATGQETKPKDEDKAANSDEDDQVDDDAGAHGSDRAAHPKKKQCKSTFFNS